MLHPVKEYSSQPLKTRERSDLGLLDIIHYLENNMLPEDDQSARTLILHRINIQLLKECYTTLPVTRHFALLFLIPTECS